MLCYVVLMVQSYSRLLPDIFSQMLINIKIMFPSTFFATRIIIIINFEQQTDRKQ